jgi:hypothetical protein
MDYRAIARFFDMFVAAFGTFDGEAIGRLFITPGIALKQDDTLECFATSEDLVAYYQKALDHYRAVGCRSCRYSDVTTTFLNSRSAIATVSWELLRADGSVLSSWRQAYFLSRRPYGWRIYGSAFIA